MPVSELKVPTSTVASLIGSKGQKVTDINQSSGASVSFDSANANSVFTTAYIRGNEEQTKKAIAIIKISVLNAKAADFVPVEDTANNNLVENVVKLDLDTFAVETARSAFSSWY